MDTNERQDALAKAAALHRSGRVDQAIEAYRDVVRADPYNPAALHLISLALFERGETAEAASSLERALALQPDLQGGHFNLGLMLKALERHPAAANAFLRAVAAQPNDAEARQHLAIALNAAGRHAEAIPHFEWLLARAPNNVECHHGYAIALQAMNRHAEAILHYRRVTVLNPRIASAHMNLGNALHELGRDAQAVPFYQNALAMRPDYVEGHMNLANCLHALGRYYQAAEHYDRAINLKPDWAAAKFNKAMLSLSHRRFAEGWALYEQRFDAVPTNKPRAYRQPRWDGKPVEALLVWGEQGLGDQILHAGMIPDLAGRADKLIVEVEPRLVPLFARSFAHAEMIALADALYEGKVDAQIALTSLGRLLRPDIRAFPRRERGYLAADTAQADELRQRLHADGRRVIGLSWLSHNPRTGMSKSAALRDFAPLLELPDCRFIDLQYGDTGTERQEVTAELGVTVERLDEIDNTQDIDGLAALISACDVVATVSNTTAHLSGALGVPTFTFVPQGHTRMWYWFADGSESPWYPRLWLRRQQPEQPWRDLIAAAMPDISAALPERSPAAPDAPAAVPEIPEAAPDTPAAVSDISASVADAPAAVPGTSAAAPDIPEATPDISPEVQKD